MTIVNDLKAARDLISDPAKWTQGAFARHSNGRAIGPEEKNAACWCGAGAVIKLCVHFDRSFELLDAACRKQTKERPAVPYVNDHLGHAAILQAFNFAIQGAEKSP